MWKCRLGLLEPFVEHLCQKNLGIVYERTKCRLRVCWWPGLRPRGLELARPKHSALVTGWPSSPCAPYLWKVATHKINPGLVIFWWSSGKKKSAPSADFISQLTSHFGYNTGLTRDEWNGAKWSRCFCRLVWQSWLLHHFICFWYSYHSERARLISHTTCTFSPWRRNLFCDLS